MGIPVSVEVEIAPKGIIASSTAVRSPLLADSMMEDFVVEEECGCLKGGGIGVGVMDGGISLYGEGHWGGNNAGLVGDGFDGEVVLPINIGLRGEGRVVTRKLPVLCRFRRVL